MIKFKSTAYPMPSEGKDFKHVVKGVVPNRAMSLKEILERFTRNEALPIGQDAQYHDSDVDLEKLRHMDLVDRAEYAQKMADVQKQHAQQEKAKHAKAVADAKAKIEAEARAAAEADKKEDPAKGSSGSAK